MPYFERFDVVEAWYVWLCAHHCGVVHSREQADWWRSYNRLSTMEARLKFRPSPSLTYRTLTENSRLIYHALCKRVQCEECNNV